MKKRVFTIGMIFPLIAFLMLSSCNKGEKLIIKNGKDRLMAYDRHLEMEKNSSFSSLNWQFIGPKNTSGRMTDAAVSPDKDFILTASASGGVWKTTDEGESWSPVFEKEISSSIGDIAIAPSDKNIIWVGTGESNIFRSSHAGCGIYKSTDGGKSFVHMGLENSNTISRIIIHPENPDIVYVGVSGNEWTPSIERGLYMTTDGGSTWELTLQKDELTGVIDVDMDPTDSNILYASTWQRIRKKWNDPRTEPGYTGCSIYKSVDAGKTWTEISQGLMAPEYRGRIGIDIAYSNPEVVYAYIDDYEVVREPTEAERNDTYGLPSCGFIRGAQLFRSDNKGESWERVSPLDNPILQRLCNTYGWVFGQITVDPTDENTIYLQGVSVGVTKDGGKTWERFRNNGGDNHGIWIDKDDNQFMIVNNDQGVHITRDGGENWLSSYERLPAVQFFNVNYDMSTPFKVYGSVQDHGSRRGEVILSEGRDNIPAVDWENAPGGEGSHHAIDPNDPNLVYSAGFYGTLSRADYNKPDTIERMGRDGNITRYISPSTNKNIVPKAEEGEPPLRGQWLAAFILSPHDSKTIYHGMQYLFKSTDQGDSWERISPDLSHNNPDRLGDVKHQTITAVSESPLKKGLLYVGTDDGRVWMSPDDGAQWKEIVEGIAPDRWISRIVASGFDEATVYMVQNGKRDDDFNVYAWMSEDYGKTWKDISANIPLGTVNVIREDPLNKDILYIGTDVGVYVSKNRGNSWEVLGGNLPSCFVHDLIIHPRDNIIVIATHGRGMYALDANPVNGGGAE
ncbi:MAG: hypothetical protein V2I37_04330 [Marinilabiliaceae bacterium]|jgi:photosystem II stability/assembly factor-like uncharacterized protein|nr:hypothetical protein [Marinilabiliaceae bacterium]